MITKWRNARKRNICWWSLFLFVFVFCSFRCRRIRLCSKTHTTHTNTCSPREKSPHIANEEWKRRRLPFEQQQKYHNSNGIAKSHTIIIMIRLFFVQFQMVWMEFFNIQGVLRNTTDRCYAKFLCKLVYCDIFHIWVSHTLSRACKNKYTHMQDLVKTIFKSNIHEYNRLLNFHSESH